MTTLTSVADSWQTYRDGVIPKGASDIQVEECRRAFYAGAYFMLLNIADGITSETADEDGVAALEALKAECEAFVAGLTNRKPRPPVPTTPIIEPASYTIPDPHDIKRLLQQLGARIDAELPEGWGFNLLLFEFSDQPGAGLFYIANAERADVIAMMREWIRRQIQ